MSPAQAPGEPGTPSLFPQPAPGTGKVPSAPINQEQTAFPRAEPAGSAPSACHPHVPKRPRHQDNTSTDSFFLYIRTFISQRENIVSDSQIIVGKISICFLFFTSIDFHITSLIPSDINSSRKQINSLSTINRAICALQQTDSNV